MGRMPTSVIYLNNLSVLGACDHVLNVRDGARCRHEPDRLNDRFQDIANRR